MVTPAKGPEIVPIFVNVTIEPSFTTPRLVPDEIVPKLTRLSKTPPPFTYTPHWLAVDMVPLFINEALVEDDNIAIGSPFRPDPALLDTVTPELITIAAPVFRVSGFDPKPLHEELTTNGAITVAPLLHCAVALLWKITPPRIVVHVRNRTKFVRILVFYVYLIKQFIES